MLLTEFILNYLKNLEANCSDKTEFISQDKNSMSLNLTQESCLTISEKGIFLNEKNLLSKIIPSKSKQISQYIDQNKFQEFCSKLKLSAVNHLGIAYSSTDLKQEIQNYQNLLSNTDLKLYEENATSPYNRWLFIGNSGNWENPLFELVLNQSQTPRFDAWTPHFQIDFDTQNTYQELEELSKKFLSKNFFTWKLNVENYGVVLAMGQLANLNGTKIYLGLRTNLGDKKYHRQEMLTEIL